jgi:hypothetical protein
MYLHGAYLFVMCAAKCTPGRLCARLQEERLPYMSFGIRRMHQTMRGNPSLTGVAMVAARLRS